jgi:hypothetical protein
MALLLSLVDGDSITSCFLKVLGCVLAAGKLLYPWEVALSLMVLGNFLLEFHRTRTKM